jgi:hypothetical protein
LPASQERSSHLTRTSGHTAISVVMAPWNNTRRLRVTLAEGHLIIFDDDDITPCSDWLSVYWRAYCERPELLRRSPRPALRERAAVTRAHAIRSVADHGPGLAPRAESAGQRREIPPLRSAHLTPFLRRRPYLRPRVTTGGATLTGVPWRTYGAAVRFGLRGILARIVGSPHYAAYLSWRFALGAIRGHRERQAEERRAA